MMIILACVAYVLSGNMSLIFTQDNAVAHSTSEQSPASQSCTAHRTVEDATLSAYRRDQLDATLQLYRVHLDTLQVEPVKTPTVRLVVEESR